MLHSILDKQSSIDLNYSIKVINILSNECYIRQLISILILISRSFIIDKLSRAYDRKTD